MDLARLDLIAPQEFRMDHFRSLLFLHSLGIFVGGQVTLPFSYTDKANSTSTQLPSK